MPETDQDRRPPAARQDDPVTRADDHAPGPAAPRDPNEPTRAFREASTPGPQADDRVTRPDLAEAPPEAPAKPSRFPPIPGYALEQFVGQGGMGVVYRARHHATGRTVALKLITPRGASDETARARFVREVQTLSSIKHPNIVPLYDAGEWHGFPFCTMEFVAGGNLSTHLDRVRADRSGAVALVAKVARAVERLHAANILHRDIKPLNILLGENDEPLVADFGLAKWTDDESDLTISRVAVGTRPYMAPEQTLGRRQSYTPACDVWALGVTLYEVLTGRRPFGDDGVTDVSHRIRNTEPQSLAELAPDLPDALRAVVMKCLAKNPGDRYPTAAALADDLERWLRQEPVLAPVPTKTAVGAPPEPSAQTARTKPRRRTRVAVLAVALVALVALGTALLLPGQPIEKQLTAGKTVRLTDDKGRPLVKPADDPERGLQRDTWDGYHCFSRHGIGITNFIDVPLPEEYVVEADMAVGFNTNPGQTHAGIYVGRRAWPGIPYRFESSAMVTVGPRFNAGANLRELKGVLGLFAWGRNSDWLTGGHSENATVWGETVDKPRFARVRLEVRKTAISAEVDGVQLTPMPLDRFASALNLEIADRRKQDDFPAFDTEAPLLGTGIGIFCVYNLCVVRNLTVTKLAP